MKIKRITALILTLIIVAMLPISINAATFNTQSTGAANDSGDCGTNVTYNFDGSTGTLTISGTGAMNDYDQYSSTAAPWYSYSQSITSVIINSGVTCIGNNAFRECQALTGIEIPTSVTRIGEYAFCGCHALTGIEIPTSVTFIGEDAFWDCQELTSVKIPSNVKTIENSSFSNCSKLASVELPSGIISIGDGAFSDCSELVEINIPTSVTSIGEHAFYQCKSLENIQLSPNIKSIEPFAFYYCEKLKNIEIPEGVTAIKDHAFAACLSFTSVIIPSSVTSLEDWAFNYCPNLKSAYIHNKDLAFGEYVFEKSAADFTIYSYSGSTAQTYAATAATFSENYSRKFVNTIIDSKSNSGQKDPEPTEYSDKTTVTADDFAISDIDKKVFTGVYGNENYSPETAISYPHTLKEVGAVNTFYSNWTDIGTLEEEADDDMGANVTTSGFELYGSQLREKTNSWSAGLRFCTRVSKSLLEEITNKTGGDVECGYLLCKKDSVPADGNLKVGMTTVNGSTVTEFAAPKKYYDGEKYFVYTAVVLNIPEELESMDIVARPFIKYTDANGILRYYYFTENGASNCGGGYYTSYSAVKSAHDAAQG